MDSLPATFGGPGLRPRRSSHQDELRDGRLWHSCGSDSEYGRLRRVLLVEPTGDERFGGSPDAHLMLRWPHPRRLRRQFEALRGAFESLDTEVEVIRDDLCQRPNFLFQRDLFAMTRDGAIVARPASQQRAGEECIVARHLAAERYPVVGSMRGHATLEGADLLWCSPSQLLVGLGSRTNAVAAEQIRRLLAPEVEIHPVPLPGGTQHLLGILVFLDRDLALVDRDLAPASLVRLLVERGVTPLLLPPEEELRRKRGANLVTVAPRVVVMPAGCPRLRRRLEAHHVRVVEVDVSEYLAAGGGIACATGILHRESPDAGPGMDAAD